MCVCVWLLWSLTRLGSSLRVTEECIQTERQFKNPFPYAVVYGTVQICLGLDSFKDKLCLWEDGRLFPPLSFTQNDFFFRHWNFCYANQAGTISNSGSPGPGPRRLPSVAVSRDFPCLLSRNVVGAAVNFLCSVCL